MRAVVYMLLVVALTIYTLYTLHILQILIITTSHSIVVTCFVSAEADFPTCVEKQKSTFSYVLISVCVFFKSSFVHSCSYVPFSSFLALIFSVWGHALELLDVFSFHVFSFTFERCSISL